MLKILNFCLDKVECVYNDDFKWRYAIILKDQVGNLNAFNKNDTSLLKKRLMVLNDVMLLIVSQVGSS